MVKGRNTRWLGVAIHHAKLAKAHNYPHIHHDTPGKPTVNTLKRLWWCCVLRDRVLPLGCRRSIQITHLNFDFSSHQPLGPKDLESEMGDSLVYDHVTKQQLAEILHHTLQLCVLLTDVLLMTYPLLDPADTRHWILPEELRKLQGCRLALRRWNREAMCSVMDMGGYSCGLEFDKSVALCRDLMFMYFQYVALRPWPGLFDVRN